MSSNAIPGWVRDLVCKRGGIIPWFKMTKTFKSSHLNLAQNRLPIPSQYVELNLIPMLSEAEKAAANLLHPTSRRNMPSTSHVQGRKHEGLEVCVYSRSGFRFHSRLTRWDSTESTVIKGTEYKFLLDWSFLKENDEVELWGFRQGEEAKLCFALGKKTR